MVKRRKQQQVDAKNFQDLTPLYQQQRQRQNEEDRKRSKALASMSYHCVYLMYNSCKNSKKKPKTFIGCDSDVLERMLEHNGILGSSSKGTPKAQGSWKLLCILLVPPDIDAKELQSRWREKSRGPKRRVNFGLGLSRELGLFLFISEEELGPDNQETSMPKLMKLFHQQEKQRRSVIDAMRQELKQCR